MKLRTVFFLFFSLITLQNLYSQNKTIAVLDLKSIGISATEAAIITSRLRADLFRTQKFTVVEREKMNEILAEQGFQLSGCSSDECIVEAGKLLGVKQIVAGEIGKLGRLYTLTVRLVDVQTGKLLQIATHDCSCAIEDVLITSTANVAGQLAGSVNYASSQLPSRPPTSKSNSIFLTNPELRYAQSLINRKKFEEASSIVNHYLTSSTDAYREEAMAMQILWNFSTDANEDFEKLKAYFPGSRFIAPIDKKLTQKKKVEKNKQKLKPAARVATEQIALRKNSLSISQLLVGTKGLIIGYSNGKSLKVKFSNSDWVKIGSNCFVVRFLKDKNLFQIITHGKVESLNGTQAIVQLSESLDGLKGMDCVVY